MIISVVVLSCNKTKKDSEDFRPNTGQIQVLNSCGYSGAAEAMRNFLSEKGFDVVEFGNAEYWNFSETIIVSRTKNTQIAEDLARILHTENMVQIIDSSCYVDASVFVGKDYTQLLLAGRK
ncbi:MAG: LytR C-terminal domain-containing protein [Fibrobacteria bacterium]|nr:LytR C-terminal domain-containing protein [Fibrobacteria bacterium]